MNISRVHPIHKRYRPRSDVTRDRVRTIKEEIAAVDPRFRSVGLSLYFEPHGLVHPHELKVEMLPNDSLRVWPVPLLAAPIFLPAPMAPRVTVLSPAALFFRRLVGPLSTRTAPTRWPWISSIPMPWIWIILPQ